MADRDEDLALLNKVTGNRPVSKRSLTVVIVCAGLVWILATISSLLGQSTGIVVAFLLSMSALLMALNYYVVGPLVRETQRLRADIEALRSPQRVADPGAALDRGGG